MIPLIKECPACGKFIEYSEYLYHFYLGKPICVKNPKNKLNCDFLFGLFFGVQDELIYHLFRLLFGISVGSLIALVVFLLI